MRAKLHLIIRIVGVVALSALLIMLFGCKDKRPFTVSGQVINEATGKGLSGVTLGCGSYGIAVTDSEGKWVKVGLQGTVTITPTSPGWVFDPQNLKVTKATKDLSIKARPDGKVVIKVGAGGSHAFAVKNNGTVWACGRNEFGQLGDGTTTDRHTPVQVNGLSNVKAITGGNTHTVALTNDGAVWTWGRNDCGQLGDGTETNRLTPFQIGGLSNITAIASGGNHTVALKDDGTVWVWGDNTDGQLGDGTRGTYRITPVQVSGLGNIIAITAGYSHTVALKDDGTVWAWGSNSDGELGGGATSLPRLTPDVVSDLSNVSAIIAGFYYTAALKNDGTVWAWGRNDMGQLGDDTTDIRSTPVQVGDLSNVTAITAGMSHTVALKNDGTVWAWGRNDMGQLGDGTTSTPRLTPVVVSGLSNVTAITAGLSHTVALKDDGTVWAWGYNAYGQLGDGTTSDRSAPVQVFLNQ